MSGLDDTDFAILRLLAEDAGQGAGAIGRACGLSQPAAWRRIRRLRDAGVVRCLVKRTLAPLFVTSFEDLRETLAFEGRIGKASPCYSFATQALL